MNQILKLIIFLSVCCVAHGQCPGLKVYDGDVMIDTNSVCIRQYKRAECIDFYQSFNPSKLPKDFPKSDFSVDPPSYLLVKGTQNLRVINGANYMYPGLSIQWKPPFSEASRRSCYGYLVAWFVPDGSVTMCQLFHINKMPQKTLLFQYNVPAVSQRVVFTIRVYSMPPKGPQYKDNEQAFISRQITTPYAYRAGAPSEWSPFVSQKTLNNGTVLVSVSLPPANYSITEFDVYLQSTETDTVVDSKPYSAGLMTDEITDFTIPMTASNSGFYIVVVWARDKFRYVDGQCQCWAWQNNVRTCKNTCGGTRTPVFYVNITNKPLQKQDTAGPTTIPVLQATLLKMPSMSESNQRKLVPSTDRRLA
ncbi:hypothetical protein BsWGS_00847 [Bradybaena similaris]